jgi:hypothetical protein
MSEVPEGTVSEVMCWVDDDPARAQQALDAEYAGQNRSTLIGQLEAIASKEDSVTKTAEAPEQTEDIGEPIVPDLVLNTTSNDVTVGVLHRRAADVEVPEYDDLNEVETIEADPVDYFQVAGSPQGAVLSFNGAAYAFSASQVAAFKAALDRVLAGLTL